jgi:hypothetical protein
MSMFRVLLLFVIGNLASHIDELGEVFSNIDMLATGLAGSEDIKGFMTPDDSQLAVAKGRNLAEMISELSHNATLSLLLSPTFTYVTIISLNRTCPANSLKLI